MDLEFSLDNLSFLMKRFLFQQFVSDSLETTDFEFKSETKDPKFLDFTCNHGNINEKVLNMTIIK